MSSDDLIREAQDPATTPARLQELATTDPVTWVAIAANPSAYDGLLDWLGRKGDDTVRATIAARAADAPTEVVPPVESTQSPEDTVTLDPTPADVEHTTEMPSYGSVPVTASQPAVPPPVPPSGGDPVVPVATSTPSGGRRNTLVLAGLVAVVLVLIGGIAFGATQVFGDDDSSSTEVSPTKSVAPVEPSTDAPATPAPPTESTDAPAADGDFCDAMKAIQDPSIAGVSPDGSTPDLNDLQDIMGKMTAAYDDLEKSAPAEIKDEVKVMGSFIKALSDPTGPGALDMTKNADKYAEAVTKVSTYYASTCL